MSSECVISACVVVPTAVNKIMKLVYSLNLLFFRCNFKHSICYVLLLQIKKKRHENKLMGGNEVNMKVLCKNNLEAVYRNTKFKVQLTENNAAVTVIKMKYKVNMKDTCISLLVLGIQNSSDSGNSKQCSISPCGRPLQI